MNSTDTLYPVRVTFEPRNAPLPYRVEIRIRSLYVVGCGETLSKAFAELSKGLGEVAA